MEIKYLYTIFVCIYRRCVHKVHPVLYKRNGDLFILVYNMHYKFNMQEMIDQMNFSKENKNKCLEKMLKLILRLRMHHRKLL